MTKSRGEKKKQVENGSSLFFLAFSLSKTGWFPLSVCENQFVYKVCCGVEGSFICQGKSSWKLPQGRHRKFSAGSQEDQELYHIVGELLDREHTVSIQLH